MTLMSQTPEQFGVLIDEFVGRGEGIRYSTGRQKAGIGQAENAELRFQRGSSPISLKIELTASQGNRVPRRRSDPKQFRRVVEEIKSSSWNRCSIQIVP
jgi:hypothetical protein